MHMDMSLAELKQYQGKNPRPANFDQYWETSLEELRGLSLDFEITEADMKVDGVVLNHLTFTGIGGVKIHVKWVKPNRPTGQAVVMFHGYGVDSGDWLEKIAYAKEGIHVFAMDCRGQGGLSEDCIVTIGPTVRGHIIRGLKDHDPKNLYYRSVFLDAAQLVKIMQTIDGLDSNRIGSYGQSQGGALALAVASLVPEIKKTYSMYPFLSDYKRAWEMDVTNSAYEEISFYFRNVDPKHEKADETFLKLGYIDLQHLAPRIKGEVIMVTGMRDAICPPSTQFAVFNKLNTKKTHHLYPEHGHEYIPLHADEAFNYFRSL